MTPRMLSMGALTAASSAFAPVAPSGATTNALGASRASMRATEAENTLAREWQQSAFSTCALVGAASVFLVIGGAVALRSLRSSA
jgi:hypothetical protein